jgi:hypothetical protein
MPRTKINKASKTNSKTKVESAEVMETTMPDIADVASEVAEELPIEVVDLELPPDDFWVDGKDPNYYYYHAEDDPRRIQTLRRRGFEVVSGTNSSGEEKLTGKIAVASSPDSTYVNIPGHILMRQPMELHNKFQRLKEKKQEDFFKREESTFEQMAKKMKKAGVGKLWKTLHDS